MEKYIVSREIGSGSFGKVFLVELRQTGIQYVLKRIDLNKLERKQAQTASKEVEVLSKLKHPHVVRYKESYETSSHLSIVMEYCENGDLHKRVKEKRTKSETFSDSEVLDFFVQICLALEYIHSQKILHRDLKTKNIFLTKGNLIKLGDFGVAKVLENSFELASTCIGSPYYISPEICENKPYNKKSDIWSLGCILYELSTLRYAFVARNVKQLIAKITTGAFNPLPARVNPQIRSLLINLLKPNPKDRPTAAEILQKPFLQRVRFKFAGPGTRSRRSGSGERVNSRVRLNNESRVLSSSCAELNEKSRIVTRPETKYSVSFVRNKFKSSKKWRTEQGRGKAGSEFSANEPNFRGDVKERSPELSRIVRLLKVDSEYYDVIARSQANERRQADDDDETRRKWVASTLDRKELINVLSAAELIDVTSAKLNLEQQSPGKSCSQLSVDDILKLDPSEMSGDILQPVKIHEANHSGGDGLVSNVNHLLHLLKEEITDIKAKFDKNERKYDMEDLIHLTETSRKILSGESPYGTNAEDDYVKTDSDSVYFDLELKRMQLEKILGLDSFVMTYKKMVSLLNGSSDALLRKSDAEVLTSAGETYVVSTELNKDGTRRAVEDAWAEIVDHLEANKEHILDVWECVVRESFFY